MAAKKEYAGKEGKCKCGTKLIVPGHPEKMKFACTHCGKGIAVSNRHAGQQGRCPLCKGVITVPRLGIPIQTPAPVSVLAPPAPQPAKPLSVTCLMCGNAVKARPGAAGKIIECPDCGAFVEVPSDAPDEIPTVTSGLTKQDGIESARKTLSAEGKAKCPSCEHSLPDEAPVCTQCGIFVKSGRPILTAWDVDEDDLEDRAHGIIRYLSWLIPFGVYPVYSEAMGNHRPYAAWAITVLTVVISFWFLALEYSGSPKMMSAKNLLLWSSSSAEPEADWIQGFYEYTGYGDQSAFIAKREELSATTPEAELDLRALNALTDEQQCFGKFRTSQLVTHAFLHAGILHLAGNMLFLLVFGTRVNAAAGNIVTVALYPILAIAAAVTHLASISGQPPVPMLGASGAVMGMAGAYLLLFPIHKIYMVIWMRWGLVAGFHLSFKCFAVRGFWVVLFYIMFDIVAVSLTLDDGTAHWAHIGGLIWGFALALILLTARAVYSGSDMLSLILGKYAWPLIGTPAIRRK
jgi:membrane associated rhomboid family serine protease